MKCTQCETDLKEIFLFEAAEEKSQFLSQWIDMVQTVFVCPCCGLHHLYFTDKGLISENDLQGGLK